MNKFAATTVRAGLEAAYRGDQVLRSDFHHFGGPPISRQLLSKDEARRIAANVTKLPELLRNAR